SKSSQRRVQRRLGEFADHAGSSSVSLGDAPAAESVVEAARTVLESPGLDPVDAELLNLRCRGIAWPVAAELIGQTPEATRKRWIVVCERLREAARNDA
ncbi:MAG: hypothetical protein K2X32_10735, partial [Phycisphaerales bacterium]|nr:hypothetical protein [Phycisphaerales bacterium]